ncbi:hypothetical protein [Novipirellula caenicola]|uniref:hypothetical protein n=1 Tax=Novipirellula caenicola TaxID=1536901 RepID=UPI0031EC7B00
MIAKLRPDLSFCVPTRRGRTFIIARSLDSDSIRNQTLTALRIEFTLLPWREPEAKLESLQKKYGEFIQPPTDEEFEALD